MTTTTPISYRYDVDGHKIVLTRRHVGTAYARNGNVGNPTQYFLWDATLDGERAVTGSPARADAYERTRAKALGIPYVYDDTRRRYVNVRPFTTVQAEMKANYRGQAREEAKA